jgi:hypothetical protein
MFTINNYESASQQRPTSSYFVYNDSKNLVTSFPTGAMEGIRVLAVNQNIYGNKVLPNHFILSSSAYYVTDDGFGNLYDGTTHIGNLFYAHGLGIITNQDYQLMFPLTPIAKNDIGYFLTTDTKTISASLNDYARSGTLNTNSLVLSGSTSGTNYSWATGSNGTVVLTTTVAGTYSVYYTIGSDIAGSCAVQLRSNVAKVTAIVTEPTTTTTSTTTTTTTIAPTTTTTSTTTSTTTPPPTTTTTTTSTTTSTTTVEPTTTTTSTTTSTTTPPPTTTTTTSTTTSTTTISYFYYSLRKFDCNDNCNRITPDVVGRSSVSLSTVDGLYYKVGSFTYQAQTEVSGPTYDVNLDGAPSDADCTTACGLTTTTTSTTSTTTTSSPSYTVGQAALGGIIAYILQPGDPGYDAEIQHGLITTTANISTGTEWGCWGTTIPGADGTAIGTGNQNTIDIMAGCATAGIAARLCGNLTDGGYSDWYLPSKDELNKLYINKTSIGGFVNNFYWSSSEYNLNPTNDAWSQNFTNGSQGTSSKDYPANYVRAIRSF